MVSPLLLLFVFEWWWLSGNSRGLRKVVLKFKGMEDRCVHDSESSIRSFTQIFEDDMQKGPGRKMLAFYSL